MKHIEVIEIDDTLIWQILFTETNNTKIFLNLDRKALTAFVEAVQLQNITGTHFQSLTNNILERRIFGDNRFLTAIVECILVVVHHRPVVIWDSIGGASALVNKSEIVLKT